MGRKAAIPSFFQLFPSVFVLFLQKRCTSSRHVPFKSPPRCLCLLGHLKSPGILSGPRAVCVGRKTSSFYLRPIFELVLAPFDA